MRRALAGSVATIIGMVLGLAAVVSGQEEHDTRLAASRAEQFAAAIRAEDLPFVLSLLDADTWQNETPQALVAAFEALLPDGDLPALTAAWFEIVPGAPALDILLREVGASRLNHYRFRMVGNRRTGYKVAAFTRRVGLPRPSASLQPLEPAAAPTGMRSPPPNARLILVPIDAKNELVEGVANTFRQQLRLNVVVPAPMIVPDRILDPARGQLEAAALVREMLETHRVEESDLILGITGEDLFIESIPQWRFALSYRLRSSAAVVSYARMDPRFLGQPPDDRLTQSRLTKMVAKNVGLLLYGLPESKDPKSVLFDGILGGGEIDFVELNFAAAGMGPQN